MKQLPYIAFLATAIILAHPLTILEAQQLTRLTANTTQADETDLSVARGDLSTLRFRIEPGSNCLLRIKGTSPMHDWQVESRMIEGYVDLGADSLNAVPNSPDGTNPCQNGTPNPRALTQECGCKRQVHERCHG
jgi:hypothetical protein